MDITVDEIRTRKEALDEEVLKLVKAFEKETGAEVTGINIVRPYEISGHNLPIVSLNTDVEVSV